MNKYIMFLPDNLSEYLFADISADSDFELINVRWGDVRRSFWGKVLLSKRLPFRGIFEKLNLLEAAQLQCFYYAGGGTTNFANILQIIHQKNMFLCLWQARLLWCLQGA